MRLGKEKKKDRKKKPKGTNIMSASMFSKHKHVIVMKFRDDINLVGLKTIRNAFLLLTRIYYSNNCTTVPYMQCILLEVL